MKERFLLLLFIFPAILSALSSSSGVASPQTTADDSLVITGIFFAGNEKTKDEVLYRELKSKVGRPLDPELLLEDQKRIQNLRLFTRVEVQPMRTDNGVVIVFYVAERWYIFPYPILFYNEGDVKKLSAGAGLVHQNFRGLNSTVAASFWLGYNDGIDVYYSNPWIWGEKQFFFKLGFFAERKRSKNLKYERFDEEHLGMALSLGKRFGYHTFLSSSIGYRVLNVDQEYAEITASKNGSDRIPSLGVSFTYDTRDLHEYPKSGWYISSYVTKYANFSQVDFLKSGIDVRRYTPICKGVSLASRAAADLAGGNMPIYENNYLGYSERIRGHFDLKREGQNRLLGNVELRFPILKVRYMNLGGAQKALGSYGSNLPFGISGGIFFDTGAVWDKDITLTEGRFLSGYGAGLHFHVPYVDVVRLEYAFDTRQNGELIMDVLVRF